MRHGFAPVGTPRYAVASAAGAAAAGTDVALSCESDGSDSKSDSSDSDGKSSSMARRPWAGVASSQDHHNQDLKGCTGKEKEYVETQKPKGKEKVEAEHKRLAGMRGGDMKEDKLNWINARIKLLEKLKDEC